jgi:hypothetical protein
MGRIASLLVVIAGLGLSRPAPAAVEEGPVLLLEVTSRVGPDEAPEAAPPRFALLEDGQVFVGGTSEILAGRLEKGEAKAIESQIDRIRKLPGLGSSVSFGPGNRRSRLVVRKGRPLEIVASGDPDSAPPNLRPLGALVRSLDSFSHPSLKPFRPASYLARAREGNLVGGCRPWESALPPLGELLGAPRAVASEALVGWPTGAAPASVCAGDKRYVVTFRPMLPGDRP